MMEDVACSRASDWWREKIKLSQTIIYFTAVDHSGDATAAVSCRCCALIRPNMHVCVSVLEMCVSVKEVKRH